jgi:hypothetical protein
MTPKEYKQMMDYLTRSGVKKQVKFASDIARPDPKPRVQEIDAINAFMRRNPINKADGGRIGFSNGSDRVVYKKINKLTDANRANFKYPPDHKYKVQIPTREDLGPGSLKTVSAKTKKELKKLIDESPITKLDYSKGLIKESELKLPKGAISFDKSRYKMPTGEYVGKGRNRSQIFSLHSKFNPDGAVRYFTSPGRRLFNSIEEAKAGKAKVSKDMSRAVKTKTERVAKNIVKNTYEIPVTGETYEKFKPFIGEEKITIEGEGADTLEEAQKFIDDYRIKNPVIQSGTKELNEKLKTLFDDPRIKKILRTGRPSKKDLDIVKDILGGTDRQAQEKLAQLADAVDPKGQRTIDGIPKIDGKKAKNIFNFHKTKDIAKELEDIAIGKSVGENPLSTFRGSIQSSIPMEGGLKGYSVDEAKARASSVRLNSKPYSIFGQVIAGDINQGPKQTFDANLSIFEEQVKNAIKNNQDPIQAIKKYNKRAAEAEAEANLYKSRNTKKVYFPRITTDSPDKAIKNKSAYTKYKKFFDKNYAQQGYSFVIPKDLQPLPSLATDLKDKNSSTYKNMIKQIKDVGRKFIKNIDQFNEKELFQKLRNNPNFNMIRRLMPRLASLQDDFTGPGGFPLTAGLDSSIGVRPVEEEKNFIQRNPFTTAAGTAAAAATTKTGRNILKRLARGAFTPTGVALQTVGLGGLDLTTPAGRLSLGAEAAFAPELVKTSIGATKGMKNRALQKGIQQALNLGLPTRLALRAARIASPIGIATLAGEGLYQAGKFSRDRIRELQAMTPEQRQQLRAEQSALAFEGARDGGLIGKKSGPPPISGPTPHGDEGLPGIFKRVKKG